MLYLLLYYSMGNWIHKLSEVNLNHKTAFCEGCGKRVSITNKGRSKTGRQQWGCGPTASKRTTLRRRPYKRFKRDRCEKCGFVPEHTCQLDVDHIDGNNANNAEENLQTLCANCHRLKTYLNQDWL